MRFCCFILISFVIFELGHQGKMFREFFEIVPKGNAKSPRGHSSNNESHVYNSEVLMLTSYFPHIALHRSLYLLLSRALSRTSNVKKNSLEHNRKLDSPSRTAEHFSIPRSLDLRCILRYCSSDGQKLNRISLRVVRRRLYGANQIGRRAREYLVRTSISHDTLQPLDVLDTYS